MSTVRIAGEVDAMIKEVPILQVESSYSIDNCLVKASVLYEEPLIVRFDAVLSDDECQALIVSASPRLTRSKLANKEVNSIRTSSGMFFEEDETPFLTAINYRLACLMQVPAAHAEGMQVLHYEPGQEFKPHHDYFGPNHPSGYNNRISTLVIYLNEVEEGGETIFPHLNLSVTPKKGSAVYFEYFYNDQTINERTLHSGEPVIRGEKWVATQWMRRQPI